MSECVRFVLGSVNVCVNANAYANADGLFREDVEVLMQIYCE